MIDSKTDKAMDKSTDHESRLAGPPGSTAAIYETARQNHARAEGITPDRTDREEGSTGPSAENARSARQGDSTADGRQATLADQRDAEDIEGVRRSDPEGKRFSR